jgi:hypothetical protein
VVQPVHVVVEEVLGQPGCVVLPLREVADQILLLHRRYSPISCTYTMLSKTEASRLETEVNWLNCNFSLLVSCECCSDP